MSDSDAQIREHNWPADYEIRIAGHLDEDWEDWFEGLTITHQADGNTVLSGSIVDQTGLQSILLMISRLNLTLISVNPIEQGSTDEE